MVATSLPPLPSRPVLRWFAGWVLVFAVFAIPNWIILSGTPRASKWPLFLLMCAGAAALVASVPFALRLFPRVTTWSGKDFFRPRPQRPAQIVGPAIGWPTFFLGLAGLAVIAWFAVKMWANSTSPAWLAFIIWAWRLLASARPWGRERSKVPTRWPFSYFQRS